MDSRSRLCWGWVLAALLWPALAHAQISPTYTFTAGTVISPDEVNANFALLSTALNRTGGTMTGTLTARDIVPSSTATYDLGVTGTRFRHAWLSGTLTANAATVSTLTVTALSCTGCVSTTQLDAAALAPFGELAQNEAVTGAWTFTNANGLRVLDTNASHAVVLTTGSNVTANRTVTLNPGDNDRTLTLSGNATVSQDYSSTGEPTFAGAAVGPLRVFSASANGNGRALLSGDNPMYEFFNANGFINEHYWRLLWTSSNAFVMQSVNDAYTSATTRFQVGGDGTMVYQKAAAFSWNTRSVNTTYEAASDGLVMCLQDGVTGGGGSGTVTILTDAASTPTTVRAADGVSNSKTNVLSPVRKGDFYRVTTTTDSGTVNNTVFWVPFGSAGGA